VLLSGFLLFFLVLGLGLDAVWAGFLVPGGEPLPVITLLTGVLAAATSLSAYYAGGQLVMRSLHARPLDLANLEHREFFNIVSEMALASGLPQPRVYVIPDPAP